MSNEHKAGSVSERRYPFSLHRYVFRSIRFDLPMQLAVTMGVVIASAVLTGALLVGDSMRGSLRDLTLDRLGPVDYVMTGDNFVREEIPQKIQNDPQKRFDAAGVILLPAGTKYDDQTAGITLLGSSDEFWNLFSPDGERPSRWNRDEIVINRELAEVLRIKEMGNGEDNVVSLWVSKPELIPADSSLGRREETLFRKRLTVRDVLPNKGLGRFSLLADQKPQPLAIVPLHWLQERSQLDMPGKINTIVLARGQRTENRGQKINDSSILYPLSSILSLSDMGITVDRKDNVVHIKSAKMMFTKAQADAIAEKLPDAKPVLVYLAESIKFGEHETPYSLVAGIDELDLGDSTVKIADDEIVLNDWTADDLGVKVGDSIDLTYFEPESLYGRTKTQTQSFKVSKIVPMRGTANDPDLVPEIQGVSDEKSLADWNPPFPFDAKRIRKRDEDYWDAHKTTPKAFVSLETARRFWASRFGETTTFLVDDRGQRTEDGKDSGGELSSQPVISNLEFEISNLSSVLCPLSSLFGLSFIPVKELGLKASAGTTPFNVLFLSFSFFIIASALMLLALLFRLSIERKATQLGVLLALGLTRRQIFRICALEGGLLAFFGSLFGVPLGIAYAELMLYGLHHWWLDAITVPFLTLHITASSLLIGFFSTFLLAILVVFWTVRSLKKFSVLQLIRGDIEERVKAYGRKYVDRIAYGILVILFIFMIFLSPYALKDQMIRAVGLFGVGVFVLLFCLLFIYDRFAGENAILKTLDSLASSNAARSPLRSMLCIGLLASTSFLVLAVGAFHMDGNDRSGTGGYSLVAETRLPVYFDMNTESGRDKLSMPPDDAKFLDEHGIKVIPFRVRSGDNAGCLNLYQPMMPRILGVGNVFDERLADKPGESIFGTIDWPKLDEKVEYDAKGIPTVPIILDSNTAMYSLHLYKGVGEIYEMDDGRGSVIRCKIVALLSNSILQGDIIMGEKNLLELFPEVSGYRYFLVDISGARRSLLGQKDDTDRILMDTLGDYGLTIERTTDRLNRLFAIQNTYLSTFRSLGGFGLILGTFGLGIVQLRNVLQRRKELALLRAIGFGKMRIVRLVVSESLILLLLGLGVGLLAAFFALIPQATGSPLTLLRQAIPVGFGMFTIGLLSNIAAVWTVIHSPIAGTLANE